MLSYITVEGIDSRTTQMRFVRACRIKLVSIIILASEFHFLDSKTACGQ